MGNIAISEGISNLYLNIEASQMAQFDDYEEHNYFAMSTDETPATEEQNHTFATIGVTGGSSETTYYCTADVSFNFLETEEGTKNIKDNIEPGDLYMSLTTENNNATVNGLSNEVDLYDYKEGYKKTINITLTGDGASTKIQGDIYLVNKEEEQNYMSNNKLEAEITISNLDCGTEEKEIPMQLCSDVKNPSSGEPCTDGTYTYVYEKYYYNEACRYTDCGIVDMYGKSGWSVFANESYKDIVADSEYTQQEVESINKGPLSEIDGKPVVEYSYMFKGAPAKTVDLSNWNISNVTDMSNMFAEATLDKLILPKTKVSSTTNLRKMFFGANIKTIDLNGFDTSEVTDMSYMFGDGEFGLRTSTLDLSNLDTFKVTNMEGMFRESEIEEIKLPSNFGSSATNMQYMFYLSQIGKINLENMDTSSVTTMEDMFGNAEIPTLNLSSFDTSKVTDMVNMFSWCEINEINLPVDFGSSATNMEKMFSSSKINTINLENMNTSSATNMDNMFGNTHIDTLNLSSFDTSKVTDMGDMFSGIYSTKIILPENFGSSATNMSNMFYGVKISPLDLSNLDLTSIEIDNNFMGSTYGMFEKCTSDTIYVSSQWLDKFQQIDSDMHFVVKDN